MRVLFEAVEVIQKRIEEENHRPWVDVIEEVTEELKRSRLLKKNEFK
ncbi:hypothetical protein [Tepidibacter aestuarii]|nr:hypothetical protein [Tepidibacter aestuarii]CAH2213495.1 conserved protein of unknown function [Tepidibacter aestuarii]